MRVHPLRVSSLHPGRSALGQRLDLLEPGHGDVAGEGGQQCAVGPAEAERFLRGSPRDQAVDQAGGEAVAAADAVDDVELAGRADVALAVEPKTAAQSWRLVEWTSRKVVATSLMLGCCSTTRSISVKNVSGSSFDLAVDVRAGDAEAFLQVFLVADQGVDVGRRSSR